MLTETTQLTIHPVAEMMPGLTEPEMESLKAGIKRDGQLVPIMVMDNQIIDGRHRYYACMELGITPITMPWNGPTDTEGLIECAIAINVHRRHMTISQRSAIAAESLPYFEEVARKNMSLGGKGVQNFTPIGRAADKAASMFAVNPRYVSYAKQILEWNPGVFDSVKSGDLTLQDAAKLMRDAQPKPEPTPTIAPTADTPTPQPNTPTVTDTTPYTEPELVTITVDDDPVCEPACDTPTQTTPTMPFAARIPNPDHAWQHDVAYIIKYDTEWRISIA